MSNSAGGTPQELPEWVPDEYDPDAPLRERLPVISEMEGGIEIHVQGDLGVVENVRQPQHFIERGTGGMKLQAGSRPDDWSWEIVVPPEGEPRLEKVDPMQSMEAYMKTKKTWFNDIDVRVYGVDTDRFEDGDADYE